MTGACLTVSQVQSIPWAAAPSSASLLLATSVFVTPIVTGTKAAMHCRVRAAAVFSAPVSFREKETGLGCRICTVDKLASITLGVTARTTGSERAWAWTTTAWRSLKGPGYLGMLSRTALYGSGVTLARRVVNRGRGGVFRRYSSMEEGGIAWAMSRSSAF